MGPTGRLLKHGKCQGPFKAVVGRRGWWILVLEGRLGQPGPVLSLLKLLLGLPELGQVEGSNLLSLLDLALSLLVTLHVVGSTGLHAAKLNFQFPDAGLQLGHGSLASLHGGFIGVSKTVLHVSHGGLQGPLVLGLDRDVVLLSTELISKTSGVNHCLLGLLLRALGLVEHVVNLGLEGMDSALKPALVSASTRVDIVHLVDSHAGLSQLGLSLPLAPLGRVKEGASLLHLSLESVGPALGKARLLGPH